MTKVVLFKCILIHIYRNKTQAYTYGSKPLYNIVAISINLKLKEILKLLFYVPSIKM